ncbi:MAG TPA: creatininase family protein [Stellaceae bacterium]|nr:creatininase family protein [Stellaceae bacterium]
MLLHHATWKEVETRLAVDQGIILPIGSTEQHGPNGLVGTDAICAEVIARGVGEAVDALVAPTISVGMAVHHMDFAGSMTLRPSTLIALVGDMVLSLARHGFRRFFFVNGHGGNIATMQAAFYEIYAAAEGIGLASDGRAGSNRPPATPRCVLHNWYDARGVRAISAELYAGREGSHATPSEVAVTQWAYPETIKTVPLDPPVAPSGRFFGAEDFRRRFPDGRIGSDPSLATPEAGKRLYDASVADLAQTYREFLAAE